MQALHDAIAAFEIKLSHHQQHSDQRPIFVDSPINIACRVTTRYGEYYLHFVPKLHAARYSMPRHFRLSGHQTIA
jgi:hypothetical protein